MRIAVALCLMLVSCATVPPPSMRFAAEAGQPSEQRQPPDQQRQQADEQRIEKKEVRHLSTHEPTYFAVGVREPISAKLQFSLKYSLFEPMASRRDILDEFYIAYTQTSVWDLSRSSIPFRDSSYRPSLIWQRNRLESLSGERSEFGLELGLEHESNGRGGDASRSINIAYARPTWRRRIGDSGWFVVQPKVYAYLEKSENADLDRYRGYADLRLAVGVDDGLAVSTTTRIGSAGDRGSFELQASYPLKAIYERLRGFLFVQLWNGWGETLLNYDEHATTQLRFGFALARW